METSDRVSLVVDCPHCQGTNRKAILWLVIHDQMTCASCGNMIDIRSSDDRVRIRELAEACGRIDALLGARSAGEHVTR